MKKAINFASTPKPFKFDLDQLVNLRITDEWGQVVARTQHCHAENQYLIQYQAADKGVRSDRFFEGQITAVEDENHPGAPVFAAIELPEGAVVEG